MSKKKVAVIGGGAAGIAAALEAAANGADVTIFERNDRIGKKILATGNGKCNLSNMQMSPEFFYTKDRRKLAACLDKFGVKDTIHFFEGLGLMIKEKNGYLYPVSEQASVVLDVLRIGVAKRGICVKTNALVHEIKPVKSVSSQKRINEAISGGFEVVWNEQRTVFDRVIITCGSKAAPKTGSDGKGYELARAMGHNIVPVVPALVQLKCSDSFCKALSGIRAEACIHILENGNELFTEHGEIQLTDYGISGIVVFQVSGLVNRKLSENKKSKITAVIDFFPGWSKEVFEAFQSNRIKSNKGLNAEEFFTGMLNKKLMMLFMKMAGLNPTVPVSSVKREQLKKVFELCKGLEFHITGHNGFENAQVCAGGVDLREVTFNLESRKVPGIFFAGEVLDVDGRCGGYNLQWAWTSGHIAGKGVCND